MAWGGPLRIHPEEWRTLALRHIVSHSMVRSTDVSRSVSPEGSGFHAVTDEALRKAGLTRRVVLSVPHFLFLVSAIANTDLVAMAPARLVEGNPALRLVEPPVDVPGYETCMLWHERAHRAPAHQWLREQIAASVSD